MSTREGARGAWTCPVCKGLNGPAVEWCEGSIDIPDHELGETELKDDTHARLYRHASPPSPAAAPIFDTYRCTCDNDGGHVASCDIWKQLALDDAARRAPHISHRTAIVRAAQGEMAEWQRKAAAFDALEAQARTLQGELEEMRARMAKMRKAVDEIGAFDFVMLTDGDGERVRGVIFSEVVEAIDAALSPKDGDPNE